MADFSYVTGSAPTDRFNSGLGDVCLPSAPGASHVDDDYMVAQDAQPAPTGDFKSGLSDVELGSA